MSENAIDYQKKWSQPMQKPFIDKVVISIGVGSRGAQELQKAAQVLKELSGNSPSSTQASKNVKEWNLRKGQTVGTMVTLRGDEAVKFLRNALFVFDNRILRRAFDNKGNFSFGIDEHIKVPGVKYDPDVGIFGFNVACKLARPGYRIKNRKKMRQKVGAKHYINRREAIFFVEQVIKAEVVDVMEERYY